MGNFPRFFPEHLKGEGRHHSIDEESSCDPRKIKLFSVMGTEDHIRQSCAIKNLTEVMKYFPFIIIIKRSDFQLSAFVYHAYGDTDNFPELCHYSCSLGVIFFGGLFFSLVESFFIPKIFFLLRECLPSFITRDGLYIHK